MFHPGIKGHPCQLPPLSSQPHSTSMAWLLRWFLPSHQTPWCAGLLPDPQQFLLYFPVIVHLHAQSVVGHGGAFHTPDPRSAALWYPPGSEVDGVALGNVLKSAVPPERIQVALSLFARMGEYKPAGPHWYLRQIGVDPALQGRGYGSLLLRQALEACDRARLPAYLEATSSENRRLYEKFGFVAAAELQVGDSPPVWPMTRGS
jgi:GNAT superfamily N-acetyltransferase